MSIKWHLCRVLRFEKVWLWNGLMYVESPFKERQQEQNSRQKISASAPGIKKTIISLHETASSFGECRTEEPPVQNDYMVVGKDCPLTSARLRHCSLPLWRFIARIILPALAFKAPCIYHMLNLTLGRILVLLQAVLRLKQSMYWSCGTAPFQSMHCLLRSSAHSFERFMRALEAGALALKAWIIRSNAVPHTCVSNCTEGTRRH